MDRPIPDSYWVVDGLLLAGEYPSSVSAAEGRVKLGALLDAGICAFFDLTEEGGLSPYDAVLSTLAADRGIAAEYERMPVRDMGVPRPAALRALIARLALNVAGGTPSYVHCWGGIGRTGTVIGCWLVEHGGMNGDEAFEYIAKLRRSTPDGRRRSPETEEQSALVRRWADLSRKALAPGGGYGC